MSLAESISEILQVVFLTGIRDFIDSGKYPGLRRVEMELIKNYATRLSPIYIDRERKQYEYSKNNFFFGEVPYRVAEEIADILNIGPGDVIYDLGCGRGKLLFFMNLNRKPRHCIGYDLIPTYIRTAQKIIKRLNLNNISFFQKDILEVDLLAASVVLLHGSTFSGRIHREIHEKISHLRPGSRFMSVSVEYHHPRLELFETREFLMGWGRTRAMFYRVVDMPPAEAEDEDETDSRTPG